LPIAKFRLKIANRKPKNDNGLVGYNYKLKKEQ